MATEEAKKENVLRLTSLALASLTAGVWDTLGESSFALSGPIGDAILHMMEKEMGLEIAGESPKDVINEICRIFVDEFGFAKDIAVETDGDQKMLLRVRNCINVPFTDRLTAAGVEKPFICPIMNACAAALKRLGFKMRNDVTKWPEGSGSLITFVKV
jgi:hypothetical protein